MTIKASAYIHHQANMFVKYTLIGGLDSDIVHNTNVPVSDPVQRAHVLGQILFQWQSSTESRQAITLSGTIPHLHTFDNGLQKLRFELERPDLKALFERASKPQNQRACVSRGASKAESEAAMAELKAVYSLLEETVREEE
jgi:hypothetical protein